MPNGPTGLIFDVQRFSVHDGSGVRTTVFFKGCPLRCAWCQNPESLRPYAEIAFYAERCRAQGECHRACPRDALATGRERVVRERCDGCGLCVPACPFGALQRVGRSLSVDELLDEVSRDRTFYEPSGGGVTLSGGEPTLQMEFAGAFARRCKEEGLSVGLQTCGAFGWEAFEPLLASLDFVMYDLKLMDPGRHRALVGTDNRTILSNAHRLVLAGASVFFRMPVVPGYTDTEDNLRALARFLQDTNVRSIRLLKYHAMGEAKLERLGFPIRSLGPPNESTTTQSLARAAARLRECGLEVTT